jgi:hypothetical protein
LPQGKALLVVEKVCFFKKSACSQSLSPLGHSDGFASCKAWCVLISASLPKTPFPGKGAILLGLPPLDQARMLAVSHTKPLHDAVVQMADDLYGGYAPATPFLSTIEVFRQSESLAARQGSFQFVEKVCIYKNRLFLQSATGCENQPVFFCTFSLFHRQNVLL